MEFGEATWPRQIIVLLDWEKAFDKVRHDKLFEALARMRVPEAILRVMRSFLQ